MTQKIDIQKFCEYLIANKEPQSIGYCARCVRLALQAAGFKAVFYPASAYGYTEVLRPYCVILPHANYKAMLGDIIVWNRSDKHPHGHIQAYTSIGWVSDFKQSTYTPNRAKSNEWFESGYTIFRFRPEFIK